MPASTDGAARPDPTVFRLPRTSYLVVLFLFVGVIPFALSGGVSSSNGGEARIGPLTLLFLLPIAAAVFIARTATVVDDEAITVRALFGSRTMPWTTVRGLSIDGARVLAVLDDGAVRLPCVQIASLAAVAAASGDHLPDLPRPPVKQPPTRRRR